MELKAPPARKVSRMEAEIRMHWHSRMPSVFGIFDGFQGLAVVLADNLLQYLFLVFKIRGGVAGNDDEEPGPLGLPALMRAKTFSSSSLQSGDVGSHHGHIEAHQLETDFVFTELDFGLPHFLHGREAVIARHEVGRYLTQVSNSAIPLTIGNLAGPGQ